MSQKLKRMTAFLCAALMVVSMLPVQANAAVKPRFAKTYSSLYENDANKGVYTYTIKNLSKGQNVKWSVSGTGKSYVKLKKNNTKVVSTTVSNKLTVKTKKKLAAKNKKVKVTAKVYSKYGKLQYTVQTGNAKIKVNPVKIKIVANEAVKNTLLIGEKYQFQYQITPANATSSNVWTVLDENGQTVPWITKTGEFTPEKEGNYTITVQAKRGSKIVKSDSLLVTVGNTMVQVKQTAANKISAFFSSDARKLVKKETFTLKNSVDAVILIKDISFNDEGKEVVFTTQSNLNDMAEYTLTDGKKQYCFTAHVGKPVRMEILTKKVTVNKETPVVYALYDKDDIDVQAACSGSVKINDDFKITNGYLTKDGKIYMTRIGDTGSISMTYTDKEDPSLVLNAKGAFMCVAAQTSGKTNFTLTTSENTPDFAASSYKDNLRIAAGANYYAHFRALDEDDSVIKYDSVQYESADPDTLVINNLSNGVAKVTAVKNGTVNVIVTATYGKQQYTYSYEVTVAEPSYLKSIALSKNSITMSNAGAIGYKGYVQVTGQDQYGNAIPLSNETVEITENSTNKTSLATYDQVGHQVIVDAAYRSPGVYNYTLTLTMNGKKATANLTVIVQTPPENGVVSYSVEMDKPTLDLSIPDGMKEADLTKSKTVTLRLAEYRGGVFYEYITMNSVKIVKDGLYYTYDLTQAGTSANNNIISNTSEMFINAVSLNNNICTKAATGTYSIEVKYYPVNGTGVLQTCNAGLTITDQQGVPKISVDHTKATVSCKTVLELVKNCISVQGSGDIVSCVITGAEAEGASYKLSTGEAVNIKSVTVQTQIKLSDGKSIISNNTVPVGKTLKNM